MGHAHSEAVASTSQQPGFLACLLCAEWGWVGVSRRCLWASSLKHLEAVGFAQRVDLLSTLGLGQEEGFGIPLSLTLGEGFAIPGVRNIEVLDLGHAQVNNCIPSRLHLHLAYFLGGFLSSLTIPVPGSRHILQKEA